jgi:hypothetical protein
MRSSLGEIHQWLYNKIVLTEKIDEAIVEWADSRGFPAGAWLERISDQYGKPTGARPLKSIIDRSDMHMWLYERMRSAELRQAALITAVLKENPEFLDDLAGIFREHGRSSAREYQGAFPKNPEEIYIILNDYILEGMPTDRVNEILSGNENVIIWRVTRCLHKPYWDEVHGDVEHFYTLREAWISAFVETINPEFSYEKRPGGDHKIMRK